MSELYLETSALLAWFFEEDYFEEVKTLVDEVEEVVTSTLTLIEVRRALIRLESSGKMKSAERQRIEGLFEQASASWGLLDIGPEIRTRAGQPFPVEPVRALDAIHLATMLEALKAFPELQVLALDKRIVQNLNPLGLTNAMSPA